MSNDTNQTVTGNDIISKEVLAQIEDAAREGARQGSKESRGGRGGFSIFELLKTLILLLTAAEQRDLVLENHGILGYTAADFQEAILGDSEQLKKIEVYETEVSDAVELVNTGLANLKVFTKTQLLTYKGEATYTVDLGKLSKDDITLDEEEMIVHLRIPHAVLEPININENDIEFGDVNRGLLGLGKMSMKPEDQAAVQSEARNKMMEKLESQKTNQEADRFAKLSVWEIYQPIIDAVTKGYSLNVDFE